MPKPGPAVSESMESLFRVLTGPATAELRASISPEPGTTLHLGAGIFSPGRYSSKEQIEALVGRIVNHPYPQMSEGSVVQLHHAWRSGEIFKLVPATKYAVVSHSIVRGEPEESANKAIQFTSQDLILISKSPFESK